MTETGKSKIILSYIVLIVILLIETSPFLSDYSLPVLGSLSFIPLIILLLIAVFQKIHLNFSFLLICIAVVLLIYVQGLFFGFSVITVFTYTSFVFIVPYLVYKIVGDNVFYYLINIIFYTSIFSTVIWVVQVLIPPFNDLLQTLRMSTPTLLIDGQHGADTTDRVSIAFVYTITHWPRDFMGIEILRNTGMYSEPGAFAYFLILAIGLNTIMQKSYLNKRNVILTFILLTTLSTAAYLALIFLAAHAVFKANVHINFKMLLLPIVLAMAVIAFTRLDFLESRIESEYTTQIDSYEVYEDRSGRVRRVRSAINLFSTSPFIGRGIISASRDFDLGSPYYFTGAGIWRTISSYGILFAPVIFFFFYWGIREKCREHQFYPSFALVLFLAIAVGATAQGYFMDNITMLLFYYGLLSLSNAYKNA